MAEEAPRRKKTTRRAFLAEAGRKVLGAAAVAAGVAALSKRARAAEEEPEFKVSPTPAPRLPPAVVTIDFGEHASPKQLGEWVKEELGGGVRPHVLLIDDPGGTEGRERNFFGGVERASRGRPPNIREEVLGENIQDDKKNAIARAVAEHYNDVPEKIPVIGLSEHAPDPYEARFDLKKRLELQNQTLEKMIDTEKGGDLRAAMEASNERSSWLNRTDKKRPARIAARIMAARAQAVESKPALANEKELRIHLKLDPRMLPYLSKINKLLGPGFRVEAFIRHEPYALDPLTRYDHAPMLREEEPPSEAEKEDLHVRALLSQAVAARLAARFHNALKEREDVSLLYAKMLPVAEKMLENVGREDIGHWHEIFDNTTFGLTHTLNQFLEDKGIELPSSEYTPEGAQVAVERLLRNAGVKFEKKKVEFKPE